ncbi:MAG: 4Fe-4S binding protein [Clostridia bacterium]|nr:4Fe-4S binding protein [Clostridia bacterium]
MLHRIIQIDREKCNGCGLCADACHEGAIAMKDGKANLVSEDYCDGLGDCLPVCPTGAISFEEKDTAACDEKASAAPQAAAQRPSPCGEGGCPGTRSKTIERAAAPDASAAPCCKMESRLMQWPVQIKLAPTGAPYFDNADLLVAADCTAYAYGDFHNRFIKGRITLIGCPKLDAGSYAEKLTEILRRNNIRSVMVARMEVPCCGGIESAVREALKNCGKLIPWQVVTLSTDGQIL